MKKIIEARKLIGSVAIAAFMGLLPSEAMAQRYLTEDFDYEVGDLYQQGPWLKYGAGTKTNTINVGEGSLTYEGYSDKTSGNCVAIANTTSSYSLQAAIKETPLTEGSVYMSALINVQSAGDSKDFLQFVRSASGGIVDKGYGMAGGRLVIKAGDTEGTFKIGICRTRLTEASFSSEEYELNKTYLIVLKYQFVDGDNNDAISLWVNPTDFETEPESLAGSSSFSSQDIPDVAGIALSQNSMKNGTWHDMKVDAIHVAGTWSDLFKEPSSGDEPDVMQQLPNRNIVVIENFTNTGCGPCATFAPVLDQVINERLGDAICIKCHGNYPDKLDPFYLAEQSNLDDRIDFYSINSYPSLIVNGSQTRYTLSTSLLNDMIDGAGETDQDYDISITGSVSDHVLTVSGDVTARKDVADASTLKLTAVAIEEYYYSSSGYSNGEHEMQFVAKRYMPDGKGAAIADSMEKEKPYPFTFSCDLGSFYDESQLGVVAYVQDTVSKLIVASAYIPKKAKNADYVNLLRVDDTPDFICTPDFYGNIVFRNDGENELKSATVNVDVNGTVHTYSWTGNVSRLEKVTFPTGNITDFSLSSDGSKNVAKVWISEINGTENESNAVYVNFSNSMQVTGAVRMKLYTDKKPEETTWKVFNSAGDVVVEGGPYTEQRHKYTEDFNLTSDDCYSLVIYDAGGDGISSTAYGNGYYQLYELGRDELGSETMTKLTQGTFTNAECDIAFNLKDADTTLGINDVKKMNGANTAITVIDETGKVLLNTTVGKLTESDLQSVGKGPRIVKFDDGKHTYVNKYVFNK